MRKVTTTISNGVQTITVTTRRSGTYQRGWYDWDTCATVNGREYYIHGSNNIHRQPGWLAEHANWIHWLAGVIDGAIRHTVGE